MNIPEGYQGVMPYLMLDDANGFLEFVKTVFDADVQRQEMNPDGTAMHTEVVISGSTIMFSNTRDEWTTATANLFVYTDDADARYQKATDAGAVPITPVDDQPYGRSGGVRDPFGNVWWITSVNS